MIKIKDFMIQDPCRLLLKENIGTAKNILKNSWLNAIPIVHPDGNYVGLIKENIINQGKISDATKVDDCLHNLKVLLNEDDLLSVITRTEIEENILLPVVDSLGCLAGILPKPRFLAGVYNDILKGLRSVFGDDPINLTDFGIIVVDEDGKIVYFNSKAEDIIGLKAKEIYGIHINKIIHDSRLSEVAKIGKPHIKQKLLIDNKVTLCTNRFPLYIGGQIAGAIGIFTDITEQEKLKENLRKLRNINKNLVGVLESINDGIVVVNSSGTIVRVNGTFEKITGISANQCLGVDVREISQLCKTRIEDILNKPNVARFIACINEKEYLVLCNPVYDGDGAVAYFVCILKDIEHVNELISDLQVTQELAELYYSEVENIHERLGHEDMIANSNAMKRVVNLALRVAQVDSSILIMGETGVGKEVLARAIHKCSQRMDKPFVKLNCGAIPEELLESELFGYESGAFTGAKREGKPGLIEIADGGTLFLDEIGDLPMNIQVKFLRVLQEREIQRVGGVKVKKVDFRLIAATNKPLEEMVKQKKFREDLFYRLNVVPVVVPPLRKRKEDIVPLIIFSLNKFNKKYGMNKKLSHEVIQSFLKYDWPGNVRELENTIERLLVTSQTNLVTIDNLMENTHITEDSGKSIMYLRDVLEQTEKNLILQAFQQCRTTREMANILGISQSAVVKKMQKYDIKAANADDNMEPQVLRK